MLAQEFCHSVWNTLQDFNQCLSKHRTCRSCVLCTHFSKSMGNEFASFNGIVQVTNFHSAYTLRNRKAQPLRWRNVKHDDVYQVGGPLRWLLRDAYVTNSRKTSNITTCHGSQCPGCKPQEKLPEFLIAQFYSLHRLLQNCLKTFQTHAKVSIPACAACLNDVHQGLSRLNCIIGICMVGIPLSPCHGRNPQAAWGEENDGHFDIFILSFLSRMSCGPDAYAHTKLSSNTCDVAMLQFRAYKKYGQLTMMHDHSYTTWFVVNPCLTHEI